MIEITKDRKVYLVTHLVDLTPEHSIYTNEEAAKQHLRYVWEYNKEACTDDLGNEIVNFTDDITYFMIDDGYIQIEELIIKSDAKLVKKTLDALSTIFRS